MTDAEIDAMMEKACSTPHGKLKAGYVLADLEKIAPAFAQQESRPAAEAALEAWQTSSDPLRKAMAMQWLNRARHALAPGVRAAISTAGKATGATAAGHAIGRGMTRGGFKAGNIGAAAGDKLARSPLGAKSMAAAKQKGGEEARSRMAERLQAEAPKHGDVKPAYVHADAAGPRLEAPAAAPTPHADQLAAAFKSGADSAGNLHARQTARMGRLAARHSFKAGMQMAAGGTAIAAAGTAAKHMSDDPGQISEAQRKQRVAAAKAPNHKQSGNTLGKAFREMAKATDDGRNIAPPAKHDSSRFWGAYNGMAGGATIGGLAGILASRSIHGGNRAGMVGAVAGAALGLTAAQRENIEDRGDKPNPTLDTLGMIGTVPRGLGRIQTGTQIMPIIGTMRGVNMESEDADVRNAQKAHREEVLELDEKKGKGELSEAEHTQRVNASKARWAKHAGK